MAIHTDKTQGTKSSTTSSRILAEHHRSTDAQFLDNRPEAMEQNRLQTLAHENTKIHQLNKVDTNLKVIQRLVQVAPTVRDNSVVIKASGTASEFEGGDVAGDRGWNGVTKYKARVNIGDQRIETGYLANNYLVAQSGHVLAQQNGGLGSDEDNVFAQDGGVNNGPYRTLIENPMRTALDEADDDTEVSFRAVLYGPNISQGELSKVSDDLGASSEDTDGTTSEEDEASDQHVAESYAVAVGQGAAADQAIAVGQDAAVLTFVDWKQVINQLALQEYEMGIDDLPDEPYRIKFDEGMSPQAFYAQYMANGRAL